MLKPDVLLAVRVFSSLREPFQQGSLLLRDAPAWGRRNRCQPKGGDPLLYVFR